MATGFELIRYRNLLENNPIRLLIDRLATLLICFTLCWSSSWFTFYHGSLNNFLTFPQVNRFSFIPRFYTCYDLISFNWNLFFKGRKTSQVFCLENHWQLFKMQHSCNYIVYGLNETRFIFCALLDPRSPGFASDCFETNEFALLAASRTLISHQKKMISINHFSLNLIKNL